MQSPGGYITVEGNNKLKSKYVKKKKKKSKYMACQVLNSQVVGELCRLCECVAREASLIR